MQGKTEILFTEEASRWFRGLSGTERERTVEVIDALRDRGDQLKSPAAKVIKSSRHRPTMKELRPRETNLRALFALDPRGRAVVLLGGDKAGQWRSWYERNIPRADRLFDEHLQRMGGGERWRTATRIQGASIGRRSEPRSR